MKYITITAIIKDGGYKKIQIPPEMFGQLALAIQEKGSEYVQLQTKSLHVVGVMAVGKEVGDRVIFLGDKM